jgi:hypothetical protein
LLADYKGNIPQPLPTVEITAANQSASLAHVGLWRDIYYINRQIPGGSGWLYWATPSKIPDSIMHLGPEEYFVLGDNSLISGTPATGTSPSTSPPISCRSNPAASPARFMLGRAFFVYWPAGYRPVSWGPGLGA